MKNLANKTLRGWLITILIMCAIVALVFVAIFITSNIDISKESYVVGIIAITIGFMALVVLIPALITYFLLRNRIKKLQNTYGDNIDEEYASRERINKTRLYTTKNFFFLQNLMFAQVYHKKEIVDFSKDEFFYGRGMQRIILVKLTNGKTSKVRYNVFGDMDELIGSLNDWLHVDDPDYKPYGTEEVETEEVKDENGNVIYNQVKETPKSTSTAITQTTDRKGVIILGVIVVVVIVGLIGLMWFIKGRNEIGGSTNKGNTSSNAETVISKEDFYDQVIDDVIKYSEYDNIEAYTKYLRIGSGKINEISIMKSESNEETDIYLFNDTRNLASAYIKFNDNNNNYVGYVYMIMIRPEDYQFDYIEGTEQNGLIPEYYGYVSMKFDYETPSYNYSIDYDYSESYMWTNIITNSENCNQENVESMAKRYYGFNVLDGYNKDGLYFYDKSTAITTEKDGYDYYDTQSSLYWADLNTDTKTITIYSMDNGEATELNTITME